MNESEIDKLRVDDLDSLIGFWLQRVPYVWVPGKTPETCHRYYIFHGNKENLIFFTGNESVSGKNTRGVTPLTTDPLTPSFSLFAFKSKDTDCKMVRNCFSVWVYYLNPFETGEIRMEGVRLSSWGPSTAVTGKVTVINPKTKYRKEIYLEYDPELPSVDFLTGETPTPPAFPKSQAPLDYHFLETTLWFNDLQDVKRRLELPYDRLERIHINSLLGRYVINLKDKGRTPETEKYKNVLLKYTGKSENVGRYDTLVLCHGRSHDKKFGNLDKDRTVYVDPEPAAGADLKARFPSAAFTRRYGNQVFKSVLLVNCSSFIFENRSHTKLDLDFWNELNDVLEIGGKVYIRYGKCRNISELSNEGTGRVLRMIAKNSKEYGFEYEGCDDSPYTLYDRPVETYTLRKTETSPMQEFWVYRDGVNPEVADAIFRKIKQ